MKPNVATGVFLLKDKDTLVPMEPAQFASENDFQRLLAQFPELLAGDQINRSKPRRWVLVRREQAIATDEDGSSRWALDHLFLDQEGVPTLVEVKRQSDARLRREVIGQMLDYAANCASYWSVEGLRDDLKRTALSSGAPPDGGLGRILEDGASEDEYWQTVKTNLEAGRIRLLFVADRIPHELRRVIEFLNRQMNPAEVLGVELRQFEGQGLRTIVPLVLGQNEEALQKRSGATAAARLWDEDVFFSELGSRCSDEEQSVVRLLVEWLKTSGGRLAFGIGSQDGSVTSIFENNEGKKFRPFIIYTYGRIEILFQYMSGLPYFDDVAHRREFMARLNAIEGISISDERLTKRPAFSLKVLTADPARVDRFLAAAEWAVEKFRSS